MNPAMIMAISSGVSAIGTLAAGIGAKKTAELQAFNIQTESILSRAQAIQQSRLRNEELKEAFATADAFFMGVAGRDISDPSIQAMKRREMETTGEDISDIEMMSRLNQLKYKTEALATKRRGRQSLISSIFKAGTTAATAYYDYKDTAPKYNVTGSYGLPDPFGRS